MPVLLISNIAKEKMLFVRHLRSFLVMPWGKCWVVLLVWNCIRIWCETLLYSKYNTAYNINIHFYKFATPRPYFLFLLSIYTIAVLLNKKSGSCLTSNCSHFKNSHKHTDSRRAKRTLDFGWHAVHLAVCLCPKETLTH